MFYIFVENKPNMKNIHVLQTDKPSELYINMQGILSKSNSLLLRLKSRHIYITSDEDIKEGDWFICQNGFEKKCVGTTIINNEVYLLDYLENTDRLIWCKKIILTTDQDLIKDGVQAIDDEFLEWYVKNPSYENVDLIGLRKEKGYEFLGYEIIIPKEEPTFENSIDNTMNIMSIANSMFGKKEEPKQDLPIVNGSYGCTIQTKKQEPKQETLEEAASRCAIQENKSSLYELGMKYFQLGAKWQAEQDKNRYSEEETIQLLIKFNQEIQEVEDVRIWFEQFKKK